MCQPDMRTKLCKSCTNPNQYSYRLCIWCLHSCLNMEGLKRRVCPICGHAIELKGGRG